MTAAILELRQVLGIVPDVGQRHLVRAEVPSAGRPSTVFGPVHPFGVRSTIIGHRGHPDPADARRGLDLGISSRPVQRAASNSCTAASPSVLDESAARGRSREQR